MYPGDFGLPEEDCNCRCIATTRARWELDEDELNTQKDRAAFFGLDKTKDFVEFKEKCLKASETVEKKYYTELRSSSKKHFVEAVSKNAAVDAEIVAKTNKHIFEEKHDLEKGFTYFEPDYYMAESFRRLRTNDHIQEHDLILLKHEALEYDIMQANPGMSYEEAHRMAEKEYKYKKALIEWMKKEGK